MNTKKSTISFIFILCFLAFSIFSCKKESKVSPTPEATSTIPTAQEFKNFLKGKLDSKIQKASFQAEDGFTFTSEKGVILTLFPNSLTLNGQLVTGQVDLEYSEFFGRGSMAVCNVTTIGINTTNQKEILTSGGTFYIKAYKNGSELSSNSGMMLKVPGALTGGLNSSMKPFSGTINNSGNIDWIELNSEFFIGSFDATYNAFLANFGWFNVDVFSTLADKVAINLQMPSGYNTENTAVFVSISNMPNSLTYLTTGLPFYPKNETVHLIFMSMQNNQYLYTIKSFVLQNENNITISSSDLQLTSEENLTQMVNNLP